jgi:hypothetical protein
LEPLIVKGGRGPGSQVPWRRFSLNTSRRANNLNRASERASERARREREREFIKDDTPYRGVLCAAAR